MALGRLSVIRIAQKNLIEYRLLSSLIFLGFLGIPRAVKDDKPDDLFQIPQRTQRVALPA